MVLKKKGIAVLSGVDVVHKLTQDGTATVGKTGATTVLSGTIGVESSYGDMVTMMNQRAAQNAYYGQTQVDIKFANLLGYHAGQKAGVSAAMAAEITQGEADLSTLVSVADDHKAAAEAEVGTFRLNHDDPSGYFALLEDGRDNMVNTFTAEIAANDADLDGFDARLATLKDAVDVDTIAEVEALILAASSSQEGDLINKVATLNSEISTMTSARVAEDAAIDAEILQSGSTDRAADVASLQALIVTEEDRDTNLNASVVTKLGEDTTSLTTRYTTADGLLSDSISDEGKARAEADASLSTRIAAAVTTLGNTTGSFNTAVGAEESAEDSARDAAVSDIGDAVYAGRTDDLRGDATTAGSVAAEESLRIAAYASLATQADADYSTKHSLADDAHATVVSNLNNEAAARANEGTTISDLHIAGFTSTANGHVSELQGWIAAEESAENTATTNTDASVQAQEDRLSALQDHGVDYDTFAEIVTLVNTLSGSEATALSNDVAGVVSDLGTLATNRTDGDTAESDYLTNSVIANRTADITLMQNLSSSAETVFVGVEDDHTAFLATELASLQTELTNWENTTLSAAESTMTQSRINADSVLSSSIVAQGDARVKDTDEETKARVEGDTVLVDNINALVANWSGDSMTLTGGTTIGGDLEVSGEVKLGVHTSVPAGYATGDQSGNNGAMFYLDAADDASRAGFEKGYSWYFCEDGVWFASPFDTE
jgi:hypothetical protein